MKKSGTKSETSGYSFGGERYSVGGSMQKPCTIGDWFSSTCIEKKSLSSNLSILWRFSTEKMLFTSSSLGFKKGLFL